ncbi:hypothetical protein V2J09_005891 [Rumex salicifolius]
MSNNPLSSGQLHPLQPKSYERIIPSSMAPPQSLSQVPDPSRPTLQPIGPDPLGPMGPPPPPPPPPPTNQAMGQMIPAGPPPLTMAQAPPPNRGGTLVPLNRLTGPMMPFQQSGDSALYFSSDDRVLSKHVEETHVPDDSRIDEVRPLFYLVKDLLAQTTQTANQSIPGTLARKEFVMESRNAQTSVNIPNLGLIVERISYELASRRWGGVTSDAHETTMSILRLLSHFTWEAKAVLTMAAFAMSYGEFWLLAQIFSSNSLAKSMAMLKQLPMVMEHTGSFRSVFEAIDELIQAMLSVIDCVIRIRELPPIYVPEDDPAVKAARTQIPIAVYWTIRSAVTAATQITALTNMGYEYMVSSTEVYELQNRTHKLTTIHSHFTSILNKLMERIDEKRESEAYEMLVSAIYKSIHIDNMPVLTRILHLDSLRRKNVLLLISDLEISMEELSILEQIYSDSKIHAYEILWLPIVDRSVPWTEPMQAQFEKLRSTMPWYSVHHPSVITSAFVKFSRAYWNFRSKPVLAVLDTRGRVLSPNAMHMMLVWGSNAFPFTTEREENLWKDETWCLDLLIDGIDTTVLNWIRDGKYIFMYGGDDINLIRRFAKEARAVAQAAGIKLEMIYVGKSNKKEVVRKICAAIDSDPEVVSSFWSDPPMVWFFWKRIESMLFSKMELKKADDHSDVIIQEVKKILSYDKFPGGWALLSRGSEVILHGQMSTVLTALLRYERETPFWKKTVPPLTFPEAFRQQTSSIHVQDLPCCRFEFPAVADPVGLLCPECHRSMDKHTTFVCCHEGPAHERSELANAADDCKVYHSQECVSSVNVLLVFYMIITLRLLVFFFII